MPLVTYADSDDDEDGFENATTAPQSHSAVTFEPEFKRRRSSLDRSTPARSALDLPPLPSSFHDLYATNVRTGISDDPSLHGGRKRHIAHVEGNWPSHVYLEWYPKQEEAQLLQSIIAQITNNSPDVHSLLQNELSVPLPLHISLSRSLVLHTDKREEFLSRVRSNLKAVAVKPFSLDFTKIAWYPNFDLTRWFLSLGVQKPGDDELNKLLGASNAACAAMELPILYRTSSNTPVDQHSSKKRRKSEIGKAQPEFGIEVQDCSDSFHISLAWSLETQNLDDGQKEVTSSELGSLLTNFDCVKVKIGNTITSLPLTSNKLGQFSTGMLG